MGLSLGNLVLLAESLREDAFENLTGCVTPHHPCSNATDVSIKTKRIHASRQRGLHSTAAQFIKHCSIALLKWWLTLQLPMDTEPLTNRAKGSYKWCS